MVPYTGPGEELESTMLSISEGKVENMQQYSTIQYKGREHAEHITLYRTSQGSFMYLLGIFCIHALSLWYWTEAILQVTWSF